MEDLRQRMEDLRREEQQDRKNHEQRMEDLRQRDPRAQPHVDDMPLPPILYQYLDPPLGYDIDGIDAGRRTIQNLLFPVRVLMKDDHDDQWYWYYAIEAIRMGHIYVFAKQKYFSQSCFDNDLLGQSQQQGAAMQEWREWSVEDDRGLQFQDERTSQYNEVIRLERSDDEIATYTGGAVDVSDQTAAQLTQALGQEYPRSKPAVIMSLVGRYSNVTVQKADGSQETTPDGVLVSRGRFRCPGPAPSPDAQERIAKARAKDSAHRDMVENRSV
jgi:hypothetical protein